MSWKTGEAGDQKNKHVILMARQCGICGARAPRPCAATDQSRAQSLQQLGPGCATPGNYLSRRLATLAWWAHKAAHGGGQMAPRPDRENSDGRSGSREFLQLDVRLARSTQLNDA